MSSLLPNHLLLLAPELFATDSGIPRILRLYLKAAGELAGDSGRVGFIALNDDAVDPAKLAPYAGPTLEQAVVCGRDKLRFIRETFRLGRRADLVICGHIAQLPVAWLARRLRCGPPYILVAHGIEVWRPFTLWERRALRGAHRILCVSDYTRREIAQRIRLDETRLVVLPNALDPGLAPATPRPPAVAAPVILTVARLSRNDNYKGVDHLIQAMPAILRAAPGARLRIVGRGDDTPRLQALAREQGVADAVEFGDFVSDEQLCHEFARCALFALPSLREGFGLVYLEAMAHGKPCLAADAAAAPEVITPQSGCLVPYGHVPAIASACARILAGKWDSAAIQACAERYSYPRFRARLSSLLYS